MKTKEIDVWVSNSLVIQDDTECRNIFRSGGDESCVNKKLFTKARLIIELPEKKIEITESQLRDCFDSFRKLDNDNERRLVYSFLEFAQAKLFGEEKQGGR